MRRRLWTALAISIAAPLARGELGAAESRDIAAPTWEATIANARRLDVPLLVRFVGVLH